MTITVTHPGVRLLAPALETLADVVAGDWTAAARLCANKLRNPAAAELALDDAAVHAGVLRTLPQSYRYHFHHRLLVVEEHPAVLAAALDLHMRLWLGAWDALEQVVPNGNEPPPGSWCSERILSSWIGLHPGSGSLPFGTTCSRASQAPSHSRMWRSRAAARTAGCSSTTRSRWWTW